LPLYRHSAGQGKSALSATIYRLLVDYPDPHNAFLNHLARLVGLTGRSVPIPWNKRIARRMAGGSFGPLALIMFR
jgi:hypothetical protein